MEVFDLHVKVPSADHVLQRNVPGGSIEGDGLHQILRLVLTMLLRHIFLHTCAACKVMSGLPYHNNKEY